MPTDLSTPRWRCDVCTETFEGADARTVAEACEHRPTPDELAEGTPVLDGSSDVFDPDTWPRIAGSKVTLEWSSRANGRAHVRRYTLGRPVSVQNGGTRYDIRSDELWPGRAGALQQAHGSIWARFGGAADEPADPNRGLADVLAAFGVPGADVEWVAYHVAGPYRGRWHFTPQGPALHGWTSALDGGFLRPDLDEETYRAVLSLCDHFRTQNALFPEPDDDPEVRYLTGQGRRPWRAREWKRTPRLPHYGLCPYAHTDRSDDDYRRWIEILALARYDGDAHAAMWWLITSTYEEREAALAAEARRHLAGDRAALVPAEMFRPSGGMTRGKRAGQMRPEHKPAAAALGVDWDSSKPKEVVRDRTCDMFTALDLVGVTVTDPDVKPFRGAPIIATFSGKGGVGKTTVAAAIAERAAGRGHRVLLVDCDITGPSLGTLYNLPEGLTVDGEGRLLPACVDADQRLHVISPAQVVKAGERIDWGVPAIRTFLRFVGLRCADEFDLVVLDMPPGQTDVHTAVQAEFTIAKWVLVSTPSPLSLADAARAIAALPSGYSQRLEVIDNLGKDPAGRPIYGHGVHGSPVKDWCYERSLSFWGVLPWCPEPAQLAGVLIIGSLVDEILADREPAAAD